MTMQQAVGKPPKCSLVNVWTGESIECLFNPTELAEKVQVNWNRLNVPGLSHQVLQYQSTGNRQLSGIEFYVSRFFMEPEQSDPDVMAFRSFLRSLTVPPAGTQNVAATAPPRTLIIWPKVLTVETVLTELECKFTRFAVDNSLLVYTAVCSLEEILVVRVTSEQLRRT